MSRPARRLALRGAAAGAVVAAIGYLLLLVPEPAPRTPAPADPAVARPFAWRQDAFWARLEADAARARAEGCEAVGDGAAAALTRLSGRIDALGRESLPPDAPAFGEAERAVFDAAVLAAACPGLLPETARQVARLRVAVKRQSEHWAPGERRTKEGLYRTIYGSRAALEEAMLQVPPGAAPPVAALVPGTDEPSATPSATHHGVTLHSGDILLSRGGAALSSFIARGSDFPGNFSHVALVHVDEASRQVRIVEAHIERGVAVATPDEYLRDRKLRILVLRPRADLPALAQDPLLPHRAATAALAAAGGPRIPYDFAMDAQDPSRLFCSEVAAQAYRTLGVGLWPATSHLSAPGVRRWLGALGVRHFETLEPSDLEYDPQLRVVAEWRDVEVLRRDHLDNAVTDALLAAADAGAPLPYPPWKLPFARLAKGWSMVLVALGRVGPVPEGMTATAALRSESFAAMHAAVRARVEARAAGHLGERGYPAPYWTLVRYATEELAASGVLRPR